MITRRMIAANRARIAAAQDAPPAAEPTDTQMLDAATAVIAAWDKLHGSVKYTPGVGDMMEDIEFREMQRLRAAIAAAMKDHP